ncbi:unnamed protein product, partial [Brenthis ino]
MSESCAGAGGAAERILRGRTSRSQLAARHIPCDRCLHTFATALMQYSTLLRPCNAVIRYYRGVSISAAAAEGGGVWPVRDAGTGRGCCECPPLSAGLTRPFRSALQPAIYRGAP